MSDITLSAGVPAALNGIHLNSKQHLMVSRRNSAVGRSMLIQAYHVDKL